MAISKIKSAGISTTDTITASQLAPNSVGLSELTDATGVTSTHHKVPSMTSANLPGVAGGTNASVTATTGMIAYSTTETALMQYNGGWAVISPPPKITSVSGLLNEDTDSTLTIIGSNFSAGTTVKMFDASAGGSQVGSNATTTFVDAGTLKAVFGGGGNPVAGNSVYIEVDTAGANSRFATAIVVNADPVGTFTGGSGTNYAQSTHLGTYGGSVAGGSKDPLTHFWLNFDRGGGYDFEDSSNINYLNTNPYGNRAVGINDAVIKASPFGDGKTALKFAGTDGHHLQVASGFDTFSTSDFTVELWARIDNWDEDSNNPMIIDGRQISDQQDGFLLQYNRTNGQLKVYQADSGGDILAFSADRVIVQNEWTHIAVVRIASVLTLYLNGVNSGSAASGHNFTSPNITFGRYNSGNGYTIIGYLDEIRVVIGSGVYTGNFKVPTARLSHSQSAGAAGTNIAAIPAANCKLLIHSNLSSTSTTIVDSATNALTSGTTHTIARVGVIHSTLYNHPTESTVVAPCMPWPANGRKFGSSGAYFDGGSDGVSIGVKDTAPANMGFVAADAFTIDFWMWTNSAQSTGNGGLCGQTNGVNWGAESGKAFTFHYYNSQLHHMLFSNTGDQAVYRTLSVGNLHNSAWHHIAFVREASASPIVFKCYVDGAYKGTFETGALVGFDAWAFGVGSRTPEGGQSFLGYLDQFRVSRIARYTGTATGTWSNFQQPTAVYGAAQTSTIPTITFTGTASAGLAADEDIQFTAVENSTKPDDSRSLIDTAVGLTLTNFPLSNAAKKNKAELTGTLSISGNYSNMPMKLQVQKTITGTSYANASRTITVTSSTGLSPGMVVTGTGIPAAATIASVDSATAFTLSANPTGGTLTNQTLILLDPTRISHINGSDTLSNSDTMLAISHASGSANVLYHARRFMGNGIAGRDITGYGFQPDLIWAKETTTANYLQLHDTVRGHGALYSNATNVHAAGSYITHEKDGFSITADSDINTNIKPIIAWGWKAGGAPSGNFPASLTNGIGNGTLNSSSLGWSDLRSFTNVSQSVNQTSGFSITKFQGVASNTSGGTYFPHNLGATPDFVIMKDISTTYNWLVTHSSLGNTGGHQDHLQLNLTAAKTNGDATTLNGVLSNNNRITVGNQSNDLGGNVGGVASHHYICYAWKAVAGVSAFGTYNGNSSATGAHVNLGFYPRWLMVKCTTHATDWLVWDSVKSGATTSGSSMLPCLFPNLTGSASSDAGYAVEWYETGGNKGWRPRTNDAGMNNSSRSYIYMAFA